MIVKDMFSQITFNDVWDKLKNIDYYKEIECKPDYAEKLNVIHEKYESAWAELLKLEAKENKDYYLIGIEYFDVLEDNCKSNGNVHMQFEVSMYDLAQDSIFSLCLITWEEILGMQVATYSLNRYGGAKLAAYSLFEITFFGYKHEEVKKEQNKLIEELKAVQENGIEDGMPFEEFMEQLEEETGVKFNNTNNTINANRKAEIEKYLKLNKEITDHIINGIRKQATNSDNGTENTSEQVS